MRAAGQRHVTAMRLRTLAAIVPGLRRPAESADRSVARAMRWLLHSQERAEALFGQTGYSRRYSLVKGWDPAYPETSGYIIPTLLNAAHRFPEMRSDLERSAAAAGEWLLTVQNPDGSFNGIDDGRAQVFDTGQILFGLNALGAVTGDSRYMDAALKAAAWIVRVQDADGAWTRFSCHSLRHTYYARVAWALAVTHARLGDERLRTAALRNIGWVLAQQQPDASFTDSGFVPGETVLHTVAYTLQGLVEAGVLLGMPESVRAADRTAGVAARMWRRGTLRGYYGPNWQPEGRSVCLTGLAQLSIVMVRLHQVLGRDDYLPAARELAVAVSERQIRVPAAEEIDGAIPGSAPLWGKYCPLSFPNWAAKFFVDSFLLVCKAPSSDRAPAAHPG